jgi:3-dehydroquinate dehydratase-1
VGLIASFHDFQRTPSADEIFARLEAAGRAGADVAKAAVMAESPEDVLTLLSATVRGRRELGLPLITMSMGPYGSLTRLFGWAFGSAVSFAVGAASSAPGQLPIEALRRVNEILTEALGNAPP